MKSVYCLHNRSPPKNGGYENFFWMFFLTFNTNQTTFVFLFSRIAAFHFHRGHSLFTTNIKYSSLALSFSFFIFHLLCFVLCCCLCCYYGLRSFQPKYEFFNAKCIFISILIVLQFKYSVLLSHKTLNDDGKRMQNNRSSDMQCSNSCCDNITNVCRKIAQARLILIPELSRQNEALVLSRCFILYSAHIPYCIMCRFVCISFYLSLSLSYHCFFSLLASIILHIINNEP